MRVKRNSDGSCDVRVFGLCAEMIFAYMVAYEVYREIGIPQYCVLTSARDGKHKRNSDHYMGDAIDIRVWGLKGTALNMESIVDYSIDEVRDMIAERLTDEFEVFAEGDHIHIGFDIQEL